VFGAGSNESVLVDICDHSRQLGWFRLVYTDSSPLFIKDHTGERILYNERKEQSMGILLDFNTADASIVMMKIEN